MVETVPRVLRQLVFDRAKGHCEYCLIHQDAVVHPHEPDHIVPRQHGGRSTEDNLALSCLRCNRYKGPNIGSFDPETNELTPFYNPRTQDWQDHFRLEGPIIHPLTSQGRVTVKILRLNATDRLEEREQLIAVGLYP